MPEEVEQNVPESDSGAKGIDWSTVNPEDIPFDKIKETAPYKEQRQEATDNRLKLRDLQVGEKQQTPDVPESEKPDTTQSDSALSEMLSAIKALQKDIDSVRNATASDKRRAYIADKLADAKVPEKNREKAITLIDGPGLSGQELDDRINAYVESGNWAVQKGPADPANPDADTRTTNTLRSRVEGIIGSNDAESIFTPEQQNKPRKASRLRQ